MSDDRAAGPALDLERPADHVHALADADEAEAAALRRLRERALDLEAHPVVDDLQLDRAAPRANSHGDRGRARVLAHVRQRFLDRAEDGDALRRRQRVRIAADLELGGDSRALGEVVDLAVEDLAERAADDALRLERVSDLAQLPVELDETAREVVEAAVRLVAVVVEDEGVDLLLQELDVGCQGEDVLDRPVVQVEAEPHQPPFGRCDERALARRRVRRGDARAR